jgi:8-amino-7-oxononanoate synthase
MDTLSAFAQQKLERLAAASLLRAPKPTQRLDGVWVERAGRRFISFSCNDYLGLSHHPAVKAAAQAAIETYGTGAGASRLITGDHPLLGELEARLAGFKGTEAACLFGSGYLANLGIIPTVVGASDLIVVDELAHSCIWAGAKLSGARTISFRHNDPADLANKLTAQRRSGGRALVATEGVFSMDGDLAPLDAISAACQAHDAWLLVDDAHGLGVVGEGFGSARLFPTAQIDLHMGTLSKAVGGYGAYVCATPPVINLIKTRTRTIVYTTGLPPANAAAALAALNIIANEPDRVRAPIARARRLTQALGLPAADSAVVPFVLGTADAALEAARELEARGLLAVPIRPPTVPEGTARLRLAFSAQHSEAQVNELAEALRPLQAAAAQFGRRLGRA